MRTTLNERLNTIMHLQDACGHACVPVLHLYRNKVMRDTGISNPLSASMMNASCWEHDGHPVPYHPHLHIEHHTQALLQDDD